MILSSLKLKKYSLKPLEQSMFIFTTKTFRMFETIRKNAFRKNSKAKKENCFNRENIALIML